MINKDRIVPVVKTDLLSLIGTVLGLIGTSYSAVQSNNVVGDFTITGTGDVGNKLAAEPVKTIDFADGVTAGTVFFIPSYNYSGIAIAGTGVTTTGATVNPNGVTLYKAVLSSGAVAITAITPIAE